MHHIKVAIAGNPNSGKTTLFNALTGSHQHVGNWPGVTVERLDGCYKHQHKKICITDLPGIYSFSAYSIDETIAREHILNDQPDLVINVLDATNLERNLFLTTQLLEIKTPMVVVLNMMDLADRRRIKIEAEHLALHLDCPVIPIIASKGKGIQELRDAIMQVAERKLIPRTNIQYDSELEKGITNLSEKLSATADKKNIDERWLAIKLIEKDDLALELVTDTETLKLLDSEIERVEKHTGEEMDIVVADGRYGFIHGLARDVIRRDNQIRQTISDKLDKVMLNRILGIPIFLAIMYLVFAVTINAGSPFIDFFDQL
ncbi:MAG: ferrous iron transporter B, partial [Kiritimatiellae bacterium]|nr:ferrous iron transporter B [Kiritimatiellia bacterium]